MKKKANPPSPIKSLQKIVKKIKKQLISEKPAKTSKRVVRRKTFVDKESDYIKNYPLKSQTFFKFQDAEPGNYSESTPLRHESVDSNGLPSSYQETKLLVLVRDPWWLFAYWELKTEDERRVQSELKARGLKPATTVLRVYDVTDASVEQNKGFFDIELHFFATSWYVDVGRPGREWVMELGVRADNGDFFAFVRSNRVRTPQFGVSEILDEEWLLPDAQFWKLMGMSSGDLNALSSLDIQESMEKRLRDSLSSH